MRQFPDQNFDRTPQQKHEVMEKEKVGNLWTPWKYVSSKSCSKKPEILHTNWRVCRCVGLHTQKELQPEDIVIYHGRGDLEAEFFQQTEGANFQNLFDPFHQQSVVFQVYLFLPKSHRAQGFVAIDLIFTHQLIHEMRRKLGTSKSIYQKNRSLKKKKTTTTEASWLQQTFRPSFVNSATQTLAGKHRIILPRNFHDSTFQ